MPRDVGGLRCAYLSRYTHRVAISNSRLIRAGADSVTFRVKDYRIDGPGRYKTMTLETHEFRAGATASSPSLAAALHSQAPEPATPIPPRTA